MALRSLSFKLYKGQMWRLCLTDIFPTAAESHEDAESWVKSRTQADTRYASSC